MNTLCSGTPICKNYNRYSVDIWQQYLWPLYYWLRLLCSRFQTCFIFISMCTVHVVWKGYHIFEYQCDHDDVIKWKHFPRYWPFVRGIHRSTVNSPHKGQWRGALMCSLICVWINGWINNREAGDLKRYRAHYDAIVMDACRLCINGINLSNIRPGLLPCWQVQHKQGLCVLYCGILVQPCLSPANIFP